ncbi:unnamed protein product [Blepharisma stoltei]|uniref:Peptidase A1 domain-containing protein n=1 Tax=Blepharisma stoltei TaxID=1481888 RepID=A0AAU9J0D5_9CILI|nr:unnamed protein product [Blepharisma stoltei]
MHLFSLALCIILITRQLLPLMQKMAPLLVFNTVKELTVDLYPKIRWLEAIQLKMCFSLNDNSTGTAWITSKSDGILGMSWQSISPDGLPPAFTYLAGQGLVSSNSFAFIWLKTIIKLGALLH